MKVLHSIGMNSHQRTGRASKLGISLTLILLAVSGIVSILPTHANVPPPWTVSLDANSTGPTDANPQASGSFAKTFNIGAIINASGTTGTCGATCVSGVFAWQFSIVYDNTSFVPQGDPSATAADTAGPTVQFGSQTTSGNPNWAGLIASNNGFAGSHVLSTGPGVDSTHEKLQVFYTILSHPAVDLFPTLSATVKGNLLASVAFEIVKMPSTPATFSITDVLFADINAVAIPNINAGSPITESVTNSPPTASFTFTRIPANDPSCVPITGLNCSAHAIRFDGSASADSDGTIANPTGYFWDFGDGTQDNSLSPTNQGPVAIHDYGVAGNYTVSLRVVDNLGATGAARDGLGGVITNTQPSHASILADYPPVASFTFSPSNPYPGQTVSFDASASSDLDGTIRRYAWSFNDSSTGSGVTTTHTFTSTLVFNVTLKVTDDAGLNSTKTLAVPVTDAPPTASFTFAPTTPLPGQSVSFDGSASSDVDGTITNYAWNFNDSSTGSSVTTSHSFASAGLYNVTLTVTDNAGLTSAKTMAVQVTADVPPTASFTFTPANPVAGQPASFDGRTSSDADGTITSYAWNFGDSSTGTGATISHTFTNAGTYQVALTVTDNAGLTNTKTITVTVATDQPPTLTLTVPSTGTTGTSVSITLAAADTDGSVASIKVNWGDGATDNLLAGATSSAHNYATAGSYNVTVTVTDNGGKTTVKTSMITVSNAPSTGLPLETIALIAIPIIVVVILAAILLRRKRAPQTPTK